MRFVTVSNLSNIRLLKDCGTEIGDWNKHLFVIIRNDHIYSTAVIEYTVDKLSSRRLGNKIVFDLYERVWSSLSQRHGVFPCVSYYGCVLGIALFCFCHTISANSCLGSSKSIVSTYIDANFRQYNSSTQLLLRT